MVGTLFNVGYTYRHRVSCNDNLNVCPIETTGDYKGGKKGTERRLGR